MPTAMEFLSFCTRCQWLLPRTHCGFLLLYLRQFLSLQTTGGTLYLSLHTSLFHTLLLPLSASLPLQLLPLCVSLSSPPSCQALARTEMSKEMSKDRSVILLLFGFWAFSFPKTNTYLLCFHHLVEGLFRGHLPVIFPIIICMQNHTIWIFLKKKNLTLRWRLIKRRKIFFF